jgi:NAD(P)H-dependent flavin oxidoreductase YrpB (nitropropane dioxygenase family)
MAAQARPNASGRPRVQTEVPPRARDANGEHAVNGCSRPMSMAALIRVQMAVRDPSKMTFGSGSDSAKKVWRDIWGCGQEFEAAKRVEPVADFVDRLAREHAEARARLGIAASKPVPTGAAVG